MRVAVDIGGTFTDVVVFDESQLDLSLAKTLSTPNELAKGVLDGLIKAAVRFEATETLIHGSTVVVNAVIERKGAKTALVTTKGFRDVYEIGRINRPESFNPRFRKHRPLVPREDIFEVTERRLADGSVRTPFDEKEAREVARIIKEEGFEAVAVLFLHSYRAPEHELRMREILLETEPKLFVSVSHELSREYREYERTSTVAANAYVGPKVSQYLGDLERRLHDKKFAGNLMIMQSNGGLSDVEMARRQCIQMMESGPAGGVVGTMALCEAARSRSCHRLRHGRHHGQSLRDPPRRAELVAGLFHRRLQRRPGDPHPGARHRRSRHRRRQHRVSRRRRRFACRVRRAQARNRGRRATVAAAVNRR